MSKNEHPSPQPNVRADHIEELRLAASAIRTYMPDTLPANDAGQIHFGRALAEAAAEAIEQFLAADVTNHGSKVDLDPEYVTSEGGTDHGCKSNFHPGYVPPEAGE